MTDPPPPASPFDGLDPDDYVLTFAPAPTRKRHAGWTEQCQRRFILTLRETGTVASAARAAGRSSQSAYRLRNQPGGRGFAEAWDRAIDEARMQAFERAFDRFTNGYAKPLFRRGQFIGTVHQYDERMGIAALTYARRIAPAKV